MTDEEIIALPEEEFEAHWDKIMEATSTVYSLRPGHTLTQEDFDAIQTHDQHYRDGEETATSAFHRGYKQGLREGGSADIEQMKAELDKQFIERSVDRLMRRFAEDRCERLREVLGEARRAIGDHHAPSDCYATGPLTGDPFRDLVQCPACSFIAMHDEALSTADAPTPSNPLTGSD